MTRRLLLLAVTAGLVLAIAGTTLEAASRWRVDTAVAATAVGEPGCVTAARFTDPGGVERVVDVRGYKASCRDADPGDRITVYYDAEDPSVTSDSRSWPWPALLALLAVVALVLLIRMVWRGRTADSLSDRG